jgi:hypothetical protein
LHAVQVSAVPTIVRSDCKAACQLAHDAIYDGKYDKGHADADILARISEVANKNCIILWMPAHLDEERCKKKREKYIASGGTSQHIESNCQADELAKQGADMVEIDEQCYFRFKVRKWLTRIVQNMLVDIWSAEKERMYGTPKLMKIAQEDEDAINLMINEEHEHEEYDLANEQYEDDNDDFCDIDGNIIPIIRAPAVPIASLDSIPQREDHTNHDLPEINGNDNDINQYLHKTYPIQCKTISIVDHAIVEVSKQWTYEQFPVSCKASYRTDDDKTVQWSIKRHRWEPYQWFFETMQWATEVGDVTGKGAITFCELAVIAHIPTDGATSDKQDLCIATKLMKAAFQKYHKQKFTYNGKAGDYKRTFLPESKLKNLVYLGVDQVPGICRKPVISDEIQNHVRTSIWKAAQQGRATPHRQFGQGFILSNHKLGKWVPDVMLWAQTMCDANIELKTRKNIIAPIPSTTCHKPDSILPQLVCFYGHKATSSVDQKGRQRWRKSPKTTWPDVPPGRTLCQKCYEAHRIAAERGESQAIIQRLYIYDNGDQDDQCEVCAIDVIENDITYEVQLHWYKLCFSDHCTITARPPG